MSNNNSIIDNNNKAIIKLKSTKEYGQCKKSINMIISLLNNKKLWAEVQLLKKMSPKIGIRLRNSPYSQSMNHLLNLINKFTVLIQPSPLERIKTFCEKDINEPINKVQEEVKTYFEQIKTLMEKLFLIVIIATKAFKLAQLWLDLGQLVNHFLMVSCVTSRICIYCKALLVYLYDVYLVLLSVSRIALPENSVKDQMRKCLRKLNIKLRTDLDQKRIKQKIASNTGTTSQECDATISSLDECSSDALQNQSIDLGVPLNRESLATQATASGVTINQADYTKNVIITTKKKRDKKKAAKLQSQQPTVISRDRQPQHRHHTSMSSVSTSIKSAPIGKSNEQKTNTKHDRRKQQTPSQQSANRKVQQQQQRPPPQPKTNTNPKNKKKRNKNKGAKVNIAL